ncbi:MAG: cytochrome c [Labilithrix sp.]|nr:cytochrome c [Labilithrix sp.]
MLHDKCIIHIVAALAIAALAGCQPDTPIESYPCPTNGTSLTYASFGQDFMARHCQTCHGQSTKDRKGAPASFDFATPEAIQQHKARIFARAAADNVTMPPGPDDPPEAERMKLAEWLACGAP